MKIDQKSINIYDTKLGHNLTIKMWDSGSAGMLGEKCVMIEAPKFNTKSDQNKCTTRKSDKKWQKSRNAENEKIDKIIKTQKVTKSENAKVRKC